MEAALIHADRRTDMTKVIGPEIKHPIPSTIQIKSDDESDEIARRKTVNISIHYEQEKN